jgi:hypothetical protein
MILRKNGRSNGENTVCMRNIAENSNVLLRGSGKPASAVKNHKLAPTPGKSKP